MFPNEYNFTMPFLPSYDYFGMNPGLRSGFGNFARNGGIFSKLTGGIKTINWQSLLNNTSRTLNVINQAIPIVKQVGPMYNNMKSMLKIASLFKDETDPKPNNNNNNSSSSIKKNEIKENTIIKNDYSNTPNFFI